MQTNSDNHEYQPNVLASWLRTIKQFTSADSLNVRMGMAIYGILLPVVCHCSTINSVPIPASWQSGKWTDKIDFVLLVECGWPVFPFLIFAMICLGMMIYNEANALSKSWVRLGVFSGVFVCSWYLFAFSSTVFNSPFASLGLLVAAMIWLIVIHGWIACLQSLITNDNTTVFAVALFLGSILLCLIGAFALIIVALILSTPLAFLVYLGMSIRILKIYSPARRFKLSQLMVWVTWLTAFSAALQKTIALSYIKYSQLPLQAPEECYIATAASKGYPSIVGSQCLATTTGQFVIVNQQLAIFKAAELMLRTVSPKTHRVFRYCYDWLGPIAASKLRGSLSATAAYLCLKPAEWLCRIVLRILLGRKTFQLAKKLYQARGKVVPGFAKVQDS